MVVNCFSNMKKAIFLPFLLIFLSCSTGLADVITLKDGFVVTLFSQVSIEAQKDPTKPES